MCPLSLERLVFRSISPNTSRGNKYCLAQHFSNASENHLLEIVRETPIGVSDYYFLEEVEEK